MHIVVIPAPKFALALQSYTLSVDIPCEKLSCPYIVLTFLALDVKRMPNFAPLIILTAAQTHKYVMPDHLYRIMTGKNDHNSTKL